MNHKKQDILGKQRKRRYIEKKEIAEKRIFELEEWINWEDEKTKLASYKAFQEITEVLFDLIAMLLKDKHKLIEDDYRNTEKLVELKIINNYDLNVLHEANGLRNRVIHKYNKTDDAIAKESIINLIPHLKDILKKLIRE